MITHLFGNAKSLPLVITSFSHVFLPLHVVKQAIEVLQVAVTDVAVKNGLHSRSIVLLAEVVWNLPVFNQVEAFGVEKIKVEIYLKLT